MSHAYARCFIKLTILPLDGPHNDFMKLNARVCMIPVLLITHHAPPAGHRLSPAHSDVHIHLTTNEDSMGSTSIKLPTPSYNNSLLVSLTPKFDLLAVHTF